MGELMQPLKKANSLRLWGFVSLNLLGLVVLASAPQALADAGMVSEIWRLDRVAITLVTPYLALLASGLLPPGVKAVLVFWRFQHPLPGCRAFSDFAHTDPRFSAEQLSHWGPFPQEPLEQNRLWYRIYQTVKDVPAVKEAHGAFLLARDIASAALVFGLVTTPVALWIGGGGAAILLAGLLLLQYTLFGLVARNHGNRFVANVLAAAAAEAP